MVRVAKFADIPAIMMLLREAYPSTHYAKAGNAKIDEAEAKRLLAASIHRHGAVHGGGCYVAVAEKACVVEGFILGTLVRAYAILDRLSATDLFWLATPRAEPGEG